MDYCRRCRQPLCMENEGCCSLSNRFNCRRCADTLNGTPFSRPRNYQRRGLSAIEQQYPYLLHPNDESCRSCGAYCNGQRCMRCRMPICDRYPTRVQMDDETIITMLPNPPVSPTFAQRMSEANQKSTLAAVIAGAEPSCRSLLDNRMCRWCLPDMVHETEAVDWN